MRRLADILIILLLIGFVPQPAFAYIDPGTGSVVTTAILGFFAAIAYTFRKYMYRIKDLFSGKKPESNTSRRSGDKR